MSTYNVKVNGFDLKVTVADRAEMIIQGIAKFRNQITSSMPIVGVNIFDAAEVLLLQICVGNHCLVIVPCCVNLLPKCLKEFLDDPNILFVGTKLVFDKLTSGRAIFGTYEHEYARGMAVDELSARVLKKSNLLTKHIRQIGVSDLGICVDSYTRGEFDFVKMVSPPACAFTDEQVKSLSRYPHAAYLIGQKLLSLLK